MFKNTTARGAGISKASGKHIEAKDMPPTHHRWVDIAKGHTQEAYRLRQYLSGKPLAIGAQ
jgi:hypothetical protein